ncbi:MAG: DNA ligase D [Deltaproteobacteria bacterium]|nr:DNA ligase D [Deltaproteobacteria bacterium]
MTLRKYRQKRDFKQTPEPEPGGSREGPGRIYVIQKHDASRLHYDLRLEHDGVLKSWAVPKGPSLDPSRKRLAVHVEDHPVEYAGFEGTIPKGEYGGGTVMVWDRGSWGPEGDPDKGLRKGHLAFRLHGEKLQGTWDLVRMNRPSDPEGKNWLLIKKKDRDARREGPAGASDLDGRSVLTGRTLEEIASGDDPSPSHTRDLTALQGARKAPMPGRPEPHLAVLARKPPPGDGWLHEIKYDGYRILCIREDHTVRLITRNHKDWSDRFPDVARAAASLPFAPFILDGEVVVLREDGTPDFQALQNLLRGERTARPGYYIFDILYASGYDLTRVPLLERKAVLKKLLENATPPLVYGDSIQGNGDPVFDQACDMGFEGIVSKQAGSPYEQQRSRTWVKVKCVKRQEFVIGGFSEPSGARTGFGALLLGYHDEAGRLVYAGRVGTGFKESTLLDLYDRLTSLERKTSPFHNPPSGGEAGEVHWARRVLTAEVEFAGWTDDRILRQASFKGLRPDKPAREVTLEVPETAPPAPAGARGNPGKHRIAGVPLTNPHRILYPEQGLTKLDLARFYERIADLILPHLVDRPLTLVRCPEGHSSECFYQKHLEEQIPDTLIEIPIREKNEERMYAAVQDLPGLISLVQLGVLEIHPWGSRRDRLERPDRMIFDLDPGPGIRPEDMVEALDLLHSLLDDLDLASFIKTTGGKGFHVVVPLDRRSGWDEVKGFARKTAEQMVRLKPNLLVSQMAKAKRRRRIFVDYLRNARGATAVAPYSTRARPGAPVSTPIPWENLSPDLSPARFTVENLTRPKSDPWPGFFDVRQWLGKKKKQKLGL